MKQILITAATAAEIAPFVHFLEEHYECANHNIFKNEDFTIHIVISGVGMMATAFSLGKQLAQYQYDAAIQAGIAGSFDTSFPLGSLVAVASEQYGDLGAEDNGQYIDIFALGFLDRNTKPFTEGKLENKIPFWIEEKLPLITALSVNTVSGQAETIALRKQHYNTQIESMEGLAFHYACLQNNVPFLQIRAISNYVTPRNKADWNIKLAIENLNNYLQKAFVPNKK